MRRKGYVRQHMALEQVLGQREAGRGVRAAQSAPGRASTTGSPTPRGAGAEA